MSDNWEYKGGDGRWKEYVNTETGESSIKEHHLKTVWISCAPGMCFFEVTNSPKRECTCTKCGAIAYYVVGMQDVQNGKIVSIH
jgi:hypothetical protein